MRTDITWDYVAGFTDGEGSISIVSQYGKIKRLEIGLFQSEMQDNVLYVIASFLRKHDVEVYWKRHTTGRSSNATATTHLCITKQDSVRIFLENVTPLLIVKKKKAEEALFLLNEKKRLGVFLTQLKVVNE